VAESFWDDVSANGTLTRLPVWKNALAAMLAQGLDFERSWPVEFFENHFKAKFGSTEFQFAMLPLREAIKDDHKRYLRGRENGQLWDIPPAMYVEALAKRYRKQARRRAVVEVNLRTGALTDAELSAQERQVMETGLERACVRLVLQARERAIVKLVKRHAPKLLEKGK
jgi:hypothetical protein